MSEYLYGSPSGVTVSSSSGYIPNLRKRARPSRSLATMRIKGPDEMVGGGTTTHTTRNVGSIKLGGQKQPYKEKIFRQLYPPTIMEGRFWSVFQSNPGQWSYNYRPFLPTGFQFFSGATQPITLANQNTNYLTTNDALICATNAQFTEQFADAAGNGSSYAPYGNPAACDSECYMDRHVEVHTLWNNSTITAVAEIYLLQPKVALAPSIGQFANFLTECATNTPENDPRGSSTLAYNDVYWKPTSSLLFNQNFKVYVKRIVTVAPGEQVRFTVSKGRVHIRKNETAQGYTNASGTAEADNTNWLPGRSHVVMVRTRGVFVHDTTLSATIDAVGGFTTGPASLHWNTQWRAVVCGRYRQTQRRLSSGAYGTTGTGTVSMLPVGAFTDSVVFVNQATDVVAAGATAADA